MYFLTLAKGRYGDLCQNYSSVSCHNTATPQVKTTMHFKASEIFRFRFLLFIVRIKTESEDRSLIL